MGFDIVHFNLHKTFTQPHGGGGPGAGPIAVSDRIEPYLPRPQVVASRDGRHASTSTSTGRSRSAACAASRATTASSCAPTRTSCRSAPTACRRRRETAVLNANYLLARLREHGVGRAPAAGLRPPLHARVRALRRADEEGARARDARPRQAPARPRLPPADGLLPAARRRGAAGRADRDRDARRRSTRSPRRSPTILREGAEDPEIARNAPYTTPVRRLDEAGAAKRPVIRQPLS